MQLLKDLFGIDDNTAATIIITLTIFLLGYFVNGVNNLIVGYVRRRNYRQIFSDIMETVAISIGRQSRMFQTSSKNFTIENPGDYVAKTTTITHLDNIEKLDFKDIYNAHFSGFENLCASRKLKAFNKVFGRISLIKGLEEKLALEMGSFNVKFHEYELKWNEHLDSLRQLTDQIQAQVNGIQAAAPIVAYFQGMDGIIHTWQQLPNRLEYSIVKTQYIEPLLMHNRQHQNLRFPGNPMLQLNTVLLNAAHYYDNMEKTLQVYSETLNTNYHIYRESQKVMDKGMEIMSKKCVKRK